MKLLCVSGHLWEQNGEATAGLPFPHTERSSFRVPECCHACFVPAAGDRSEGRRGAATERPAGSSQAEKGPRQSPSLHG